jgi:superfamily I DNA/RNA helicase
MATSAVKVAQSRRFHDTVGALEPIEIKRIWMAVSKFTVDPSHNSLNLHQVEGDTTARLYTFRASKELRILAARLDDDHWVLLEGGHHDKVYLHAGLGRFIAELDGHFGFVIPESVAASENDETTPDSPGEVGTVLSHWTDAELAEIGYTTDEILAIRSCQSAAQLLDLDEEIAEERLLQTIELLEVTPEKYAAETRRKRPTRASGTALVRQAKTEGASWGLSSFLEPAELEKLLEAPIEQWMLFLHPKQRDLVERTFEGPARIGGSAGTGKTVVALHRAAYLAKRFREEDQDAKILFTTFLSSLPPVFEALYNRIPQSVPGAVEFINIDKLAARLCREGKLSVKPDEKAADAAFATAWKEIVVAATPLDRDQVTKTYVKEEIDSVIKGRNLSSVEEYLDLERTGRKTPLQPPYRKQIWELRVRYDELLRQRQVIDFADLRIHALRIAAGEPARYRAAVIDEAQDLSLTSLQLVRRLVNGSGPDRQDGLLLVGDGAQRIYASCFTMKQAGLEVRGRSTILENNYRNTAEVLEAAMAVAGDIDIDDLGEVRPRRSSTSSALPRGEKPRLVEVPDADSSSDYLSSRINELISTGRYSMADIGILCPTNQVVNGVAFALKNAGVPVGELRHLDMNGNREVRVGTFHRAKGLEFKVVFVVGVQRYPTPQRKNESVSEFEDRTDLELSALFVAMTRAREVLELISTGKPSEPVDEAVEKSPESFVKFNFP